jgi:DNA-binding response OmpR family regulator
VTGKVKILIVENDMPIAMLMVHLLSRAGCEVKVARTGKAGIELAQENKFDIITLEVDLPDISGFGICSDLKQRHYSRHTPIVFVSGRSCLEDQQHGLDVGAADYITKPFRALEFVPQLLSNLKRQKESA